MNWISVNDFVVPTTPLAALLFGLTATFVVSLVMWADMGSRRKAIQVFIITSLFVCLVVGFLYFIGFYTS